MKTTVMIPVCDINENIALKVLRIDPLSDLTEPPVYCRISGSPAMTAGNFSLINASESLSQEGILAIQRLLPMYWGARGGSGAVSGSDLQCNQEPRIYRLSSLDVQSRSK